MKLRDNDHDITVLERNPAGVTYGWGVVFWDDMLDDLYHNDLESAREIRDRSVVWDDQEVHVRSKQTIPIGGYGFSIGRKPLLEILAKRATDLGADVRFECEVEDLSEFAGADLIVACDGVNSRMRQLYADQFQTNVEVGWNKYIWLGARKVFDAFTFAFEETDAGWIWFHAYRFNADTSTFIVECSPETWKGLGFNEVGSDESIALLEEIFSPYLDGLPLISQTRHLDKAPWLNFRRITNEKWHHNKVVLMGDAAHTTHFAIGSGTRLAIEDAIALAEKLHEHKDLQDALEAYEEERGAALFMLQDAERNSTRWFENVQHHIDQDAVRFASSLRYRRRGKAIPDEVPWHYYLHRTTGVIAALRRYRRRLRRWFFSAKRELRAGRQR
jgi:anthraniloyl-CoA monooxygenase